MSNQRQRLTWDDEARNASAHPATPDEGPASPAYGGPDPEANKYENGDTSSWAEDVHPGPYPNSAHPATPDEGPASPAYKAAALERKAAKCIRIATAMLGDPEGDATKIAAIEDQALALMDLPDSSIKASLQRLGEDADEDEEEEGSKKAAVSKAAMAKISSNESRIARLERILIRLAEDEDEEAQDDEDGEEAKKAFLDEDAMLEQMLQEEGMLGEEACAGGMPMDEAMEHMEEPMEHMEEPMDEQTMYMGDEDPMGVMDVSMDDDEMMILAQLHGAKTADDDEGEEEEEEVEVEEEEEAKKKASAQPRPQPKKASQGAKRLGGVSKEAASEIGELEKLWDSAPDVSRHF